MAPLHFIPSNFIGCTYVCLIHGCSWFACVGVTNHVSLFMHFDYIYLRKDVLYYSFSYIFLPSLFLLMIWKDLQLLWMKIYFNIYAIFLSGGGFAAVLEQQMEGRSSYPLPATVHKPRFKCSLYQQPLDQGVPFNIQYFNYSLCPYLLFLFMTELTN